MSERKGLTPEEIEYEARTKKAIADLNAFCDDLFSKPLSKEPSASINTQPDGTQNNTITRDPNSLTPQEPQQTVYLTTQDIKKELEQLVGLSNIKEDISALMDFIKIQNMRKLNGLPDSGLSLHTAFIGNPGTGKTTVARIMGSYFKAMGLLKKGHLIEVSRADLVAEHVGGTAIKTNKVIDSALDGILFIDEAYSLSEGSDNDFGKEAINILVDRMERERGRLAVFLAGYDQEMKTFFDSNTGLSSRVTRKFYFNDYSGSELLQIFQRICDQQQYTLEVAASDLIKNYFDYLYFTRTPNFGNGRDVRTVFEQLIKNQADRIADLEHIDKGVLMTILTEDIEKTLNVSDFMVDVDDFQTIIDELDQYVGLTNIKEHIHSLINLIKTNKKREALGLPVKQMTYHAIFSGAPGTGKTSIARILGQIYHSLGILKKGHIVEVDRTGLVGAYIGQTEVKTNEVVNSAMDGILFVDEAYALAGDQNDYGKVAIDSILKRMDDNRDRLVVIVAGYSQQMENFLATNPGLKDRFTQHFEFKDYTADELLAIFTLSANKQKYTLSDDATTTLETYFQSLLIAPPQNFGNGRAVRNLFESVVRVQSNRLALLEDITLEAITQITRHDILMAVGLN